jgi:hypothetical protein
VNHKVVIVNLQALINTAPQFLECWEGCGPHPDNEVLVGHIVPLDVSPAADAVLGHHVVETGLNV